MIKKYPEINMMDRLKKKTIQSELMLSLLTKIYFKKYSRPQFREFHNHPNDI